MKVTIVYHNSLEEQFTNVTRLDLDAPENRIRIEQRDKAQTIHWGSVRRVQEIEEQPVQ